MPKLELSRDQLRNVRLAVIFDAEDHGSKADEAILAAIDRALAEPTLPNNQTQTRAENAADAILSACACVTTKGWDETVEIIERIESEVAAETCRKQLPESMQNCTIQFEKCKKGHGWLTATNWVQHECPTCELDAFRESLRDVVDIANDAGIDTTYETSVAIRKRVGEVLPDVLVGWEE